ncbi:hypothetical protein HDU76_006168, partial [Blyttiomyces sp. JEL0837]
TGAAILTAFPVMRDTSIKAVEYDLISGRLWALTSGGDIAAYTCTCNPCKIIDEWKHNPAKFQVTCFTSLRALPRQPLAKPGIVLRSASRQSMTETHAHEPEIGILLGPTYCLLAGTDTGQIVMLDVNASGADEFLVQGHAAPILGINCYAEIMRVITFASDGSLKIWKVSFTEAALALLNSDNPSNIRNTSLPPRLVISPVSTISSSFLLTLPPNNLPSVICLNIKCGTLAIGTSSSQLLIYKCSEENGLEGLSRSHPADEDHTKVITHVAALESLGLFASSSEDGTIKIWDTVESSLVREIQFNEPIYSVCFCNHRGDLLVGMKDQVALVRVQDYLPMHLLGELLGNPLGWPDDPVERPANFDSTLDFWELYRLRLEKEGVDLSRWHVHFARKNEFDEEMTKKIEELEARRADARERRRRRLEERRREILRRKRLELITLTQDEFDFDSRHARVEKEKRGQESDEDYEDEELESVESLSSLGSYNMEHRDTVYEIPSLQPQPHMLGAAMLKPKGRRSSTRKSVRRKSTKDEEGRRERRSINADYRDSTVSAGGEGVVRLKTPDINADETSGVGKTYQDLELERGAFAPVKLEHPVLPPRFERMQLVAPPPAKVPKPSGKNKYWIQERMAKFGILANTSTVMQAAAAEKRRERERLEREKREKLEKELAESGVMKELERPKFLQSRRPKPPPVEKPPQVEIDLDDIEDDQDAEAAARAAAEEATAKALAAAAAEAAMLAAKAKEAADAEAERLRKLEEERLAAELARRQAEEAERSLMIIEQTVVEEVEEDIIVEEVKESPRVPTPPKKKKAPAKKKEKPVSVVSVKEKVSPPLPPFKPKPRPVVVKPASPPPQPSPPPVQTVITVPSIPFVKEPPPPPPPVPVALEPKPDVIVSNSHENITLFTEVKDEGDDLDIDSFSSGSQDSDGFDILYGTKSSDTKQLREEAKKAWSLFEQAMIGSPVKSREELRPEFTKVMTTFWFPGLGGKPVNLKNIIDVLFRVMRHGYWREKCEASKALLYLFHTFERDFENPMQELIAPQLDLTQDEDWQFRSQICFNLAKYKIHHPDILYALVARLSDKHPMVRRAAKKSLATFGVDSREALRSLMSTLNMLKNVRQKGEDKSTWLDILLARMQKRLQSEIAETNLVISRWRRQIDPATYGSPMTRPASSSVTLVKPEGQTQTIADLEQAQVEKNIEFSQSFLWGNLLRSRKTQDYKNGGGRQQQTLSNRTGSTRLCNDDKSQGSNTRKSSVAGMFKAGMGRGGGVVNGHLPQIVDIVTLDGGAGQGNGLNGKGRRVLNGMMGDEMDIDTESQLRVALPTIHTAGMSPDERKQQQQQQQ